MPEWGRLINIPNVHPDDQLIVSISTGGFVILTQEMMKHRFYGQICDENIVCKCLITVDTKKGLNSILLCNR